MAKSKLFICFTMFFLVISVSKLFAKSLQDSIVAPSMKILYQSLEAKIRYGVQARIDGTAVIKGELFLLLCHATDQTLTGGLVMDYVADVRNTSSGVFKQGRFYRAHDRYDRAPGFGGGTDAGALYANWQFNQPKAVLLEDSYVNNNGILYGRPRFAEEGEGRHKCIIFNGNGQYTIISRSHFQGMNRLESVPALTPGDVSSRTSFSRQTG